MTLRIRKYKTTDMYDKKELEMAFNDLCESVRNEFAHYSPEWTDIGGLFFMIVIACTLSTACYKYLKNWPAFVDGAMGFVLSVFLIIAIAIAFVISYRRIWIKTKAAPGIAEKLVDKTVSAEQRLDNLYRSKDFIFHIPSRYNDLKRVKKLLELSEKYGVKSVEVLYAGRMPDYKIVFGDNSSEVIPVGFYSFYPVEILDGDGLVFMMLL